MYQNHQNGVERVQPSLLFAKELRYDFSTQKSMSMVGKEQSILLSSNSSDSPKPPESGNLIPILTYGGVAVAVIIAMAYFSQIQLKSITELLKTGNKKTK
jgi:hypothetical protein